MIGNLLAWGGNPEVLRKFHGFLTIFWLVLSFRFIIAALLFGMR